MTISCHGVVRYMFVFYVSIILAKAISLLYLHIYLLSSSSLESVTLLRTEDEATYKRLLVLIYPTLPFQENGEYTPLFFKNQDKI